MTDPATLRDLRDLPLVLSLVHAGRLLGIGRTTAYALARRDAFPCPVLTFGNTYKVPTAGVLSILGLPLPTMQKERHETGQEPGHPDFPPNYP